MNSFARTCRAEFAFLVRQYGFRVTVSEGDRDSMASFFRTDAFVNVYAEGGTKPWVTVNAGGRTFGLHTAIERIDPDWQRCEPEGETAVIVHYARFLRKHAAEILGRLSRTPPPPAPPPKRRATRAGALDFLASLPGWKTGSLRIFASKMTTLVFHDDDVRLTIDLKDGKILKTVRATFKTKEIDLDDAIKVLAPELIASRPKEQRARLAYYAEFLRHRGAALLAGKRSAWGKLR